jgi:iron complex outermembrane receptor protein
LRLLAHHGSLDRGVARVASAPAREARERLERNLAAVSTRTALGAPGNFVEAHSSVLASETELRDPASELSFGTTESDASGLRAGQGIALRLEPAPGWVVRAAIDGGLERLERREARGGRFRQIPVLEAKRVDLRPALSSELRASELLALRAAVALECSGAATAKLEPCSEHPLSGRIGPSLRSQSWTAYANLGRYARPATLGERFGMSAAVRGEAGLHSELGETVDIGGRFYDRQGRGLRASGAAFVRWARELIVFTRTAQGYVVPENRDRARVIGLELSLGAEPWRGLALDLGLTMTDARDTSPTRRTVNDVLPFQSRLVVAPQASYAGEFELGPLDGASITLRYVHQSSRYFDGAGLAVIPEQGNLELSGAANLLRGALDVRLRVDNALDQDRFDVVGFPLPRTSVYASLEARL